MVPEAALRETEHGLVPEGEGWFALNAREARWWNGGELGAACAFEGDERFPLLGINVAVLHPGQPLCMYHREDEQEEFLVLAGECLLLVEGEERPLRRWDLFHCPAWTEHVIVGAGVGPCAILCVGTRREGRGVVYPVREVALRHGAGVEQETETPKEAYARFREPEPVRFREEWLPSG